MKFNVKILVVLLSILIAHNLSAQTVTASINPLTLPCGGGQVNLGAIGNSTTPVFGDSFDNGGLQPGWSTNVAANFSNPCGASVDGTTYLWMGSAADAPRAITTATVDVSCGGQVCFDFKYMCEACGDSAPCEGADYYDEGVGLQYSTDGGTTWTTFVYLAPNGDILGNVPNTSFPSVTGATPFTTWNNYCFPIPPGAFSPTTLFRMRQFNASSAIYDHWGIDNFYVFATPCAPYIYDWEQIPGSPDPQNTVANVTQTTTFTVHYTNGTIDVTDQVTVTVASISITNVAVTTEACLGDDNASIITTSDVTGGTPNFTYTLTGPTPGTNNTGNFTGLAPGLYSLQLTDGGGCTDTYGFTINPGLPCCTVTAAGIDPLCNGGNAGTATATPADGQAPYTYQWFDAANNPMAGQTLQTATGLTAGSYSVQITDFNGCQSTANVVLGEPSIITANTTPTNVSCFGACDGQIVINPPNGGTGTYTYNINGGTFQAGSTFGGLCAANYVLNVKDNNGCIIVLNESITEPAVLTLAETNNAPEICGQSNGTTTVSAAGGDGNYTYQLGATNNATGIFNGLSAGNYNITVTDGNNCQANLNIVITSSAGPVPFVDVLNDVACAGGINGSVTIGVNGGMPNYQYSLDGGANQAGNSFNLAAGNHSVIVTDGNGCTGNVAFVIGQPSPLVFNTVVTDVLCNGDCNGEIAIVANGSNPGYTYSDDNGLTFQNSSTLTGLCPGNVNVVVKDASGCLANANVIVGEPAAVTSNFTFVEPSCFGICDAEIHMNNTLGGDGSYTYSVDNGANFQSSPDFLNECAGSFDIIVEDGNGCQALLNASVVTTPPQITFTFVANHPSNCGAQDGSFNIIAQNGSPTYDYFIHTQPGSSNPYVSPVQTSNGNFIGLYAGLYTLVVTDNNGCTDSTYSPLSDIEMTASVVFTQDITCFNGSDGVGIVNLSVGSGGTPPYLFNLSTFSTGATVGPQNNGNFGGLIAGQHTVTITDGGLCVNIQQFDLIQPDTITFNVVKTDVVCPTNANNLVNNGTITFSNAIGGANTTYEYSIDGGITYPAGNVFNNLAAGTYNVFARDINGCLGQTTITIEQPTDFDVTVNPTDLVCNGDNSGFIQIVANGASPNYTFDLSGTNNNTGIFANLSANPAYNITVTDNLMCTFITNQAITEPLLLTAAYLETNVNCNGECTGEVEVTANGGTPNYLYSADNGITYQGANVLTDLCAGNHQIRVKDDNDCVVDAVRPITEPSLITFNMVSTPATCGNDNATVTIAAANGTPNYQYSASDDNGLTFSPLQAATTITNLAASQHIIMVTDFNGCEVTQPINLSADPTPQIDLIQTTDPLCNGDNNGIIEITASGGVGVYQYSVNNGGSFQAGNTFNTLTDGNYTIVVEDGNGCQATTQANLTHPAVLTINVTPTDLQCYQDLSGEINITAGGGTTPYNYSIDNNVTQQANNVFNFLPQGNYPNIVIEDFNGCTVTGNTVVNEPTELTWSNFSITDPLCFGENNGAVATTTVGGTLPYSYNWSNALAGDINSANSIYSGTYSLILTDDHGCQLDSMNFVLADPAPVAITSITPTPVSCYATNGNNSDGTITVAVPVQNPPIDQFSIDGGTTFQAANVFADLTPGDYEVTVQNQNGCTTSFFTTVTEPTELVGAAPSDQIVCYGQDVLVLPQIPNGGTLPYSYDWTDSDGGVHNNTETYTQNNVITAITNSLTVIDNNGCIAGIYDYTITPTPPLILTVSNDTSICPGGSANLGIVNISGGQMIDFGNVVDYSYSWTPAGVNDTLNNLIVTPTSTTNYVITVIDECGQTVTDNITVTIFNDPTPVIMGGGIGCEPYTAVLYDPANTVDNGGTNIWSLGDGSTISNQDSIIFTYDNTGCYDISLTLTTVEGCSASQTITELICIHPNPTANFNFNPAQPTTSSQTINFINTSDNADTYQWDFNNMGTSTEENPLFNFNASTEEIFEVCLIAITDLGCRDTTCLPITVYEEVVFYIPNVFTPDGDDYNEQFTPIFTSGFDPFNYHLIIFNRWGETIFESYNAAIGWDGKYKGELAQDGVYIWQVHFGESISDKKQLHRGHVTLLK